MDLLYNKERGHTPGSHLTSQTAEVALFNSNFFNYSNNIIS